MDEMSQPMSGSEAIISFRGKAYRYKFFVAVVFFSVFILISIFLYIYISIIFYVLFGGDRETQIFFTRRAPN